MVRTIIKIDEDLCNGCGLCVEGCHEGALQIIDGKARIVSELYCDGLGACIGDCPLGAITLEERKAEPYDEIAVMEKIAPKGAKTVIAHLQHLKDYNEMEFFRQGVQYLRDNKIDIDLSPLFVEEKPSHEPCAPSPFGNGGGCPGSREIKFDSPKVEAIETSNTEVRSELTSWPIQLHLLNPNSGFLKNADLLLAADCTAFSLGSFHPQLLKGKALAIACPKLDTNKEVYLEKLKMMIDDVKINTITLCIMEVPCCGGLLQLVNMATSQASRKVPIRLIVVGIQGGIVRDEWM
jgi:ferredoxin